MIINNLYISELSPSDIQIVQDFLTPYEFSCVQLSSLLRKKVNYLYIIKTDKEKTSINNIFGFFYLKNVFLHCLPFLSNENTFLFQQTFLNFLKNQKIKTIIGPKFQTDILINLLSQKSLIPTCCNNYKTMILNQFPNNPPEPLSNSDEIKRCTINDFDSLFDLQKKYIIKEVAPSGKQVSDLECSLSLKDILKNQLVFALYSDEDFVSKANTNAIGINWIQLGGIYTHPLFRKNYYAWHLIYNLCLRILKTKKSVCLFVKEKNFPAYNLYKHIGFIEKDFFEIAYF